MFQTICSWLKTTSALLVLLIASVAQEPVLATPKVITVKGFATEIDNLPIGPWLYTVYFTAPASFLSTFQDGLPTPPPAATVPATTIIDDIDTVLNAANVTATGSGYDQFLVPLSVTGENFTYVRGFAEPASLLAPNYCNSSIACWIYDDNHGNPMGPVSVNQPFTFVVLVPQPMAQTITFAPIGDRYLGTRPFNPGVSASSSLPVKLAVDPNIPSSACSVINGTTVVLKGTGSCTLDATQEGDSYYSAVMVQQTFNILPTPALVFTANLLHPVSPCTDPTTLFIPFSYSAGINNAGQVIGNSANASSVTSGSGGANECFSEASALWNGVNPTRIALSPLWGEGIPPGFSFPEDIWVAAINDVGTIVGGGGSQSFPSGTYSAYANLLCAGQIPTEFTTIGALLNGFATYWPTQAGAGGVLASGLPLVPFNQISFPTGDGVTSAAAAVSSDGWVAGSAPFNDVSNDVPNAAALWNGGSRPINLGAGGACGINNAHTVVGYSAVSNSATLWAGPNYTPIALGALGSFNSGLPLPTSATAISNDGWVVGTSGTNYSSVTGSQDVHAVVWVNNGGRYGSPVELLPLPNTLPGPIVGAALAVNGAHKVVGNTQNFSGPVHTSPSQQIVGPIAHATFWDAGAIPLSSPVTPIDLNALIVSGLPSTQVITRASGINDSNWISVDAIDFDAIEFTSNVPAPTPTPSGPATTQIYAQYSYVLVPIVGRATTLAISKGQSATITAGTPSGPGPFSYQWFQGNMGDISTPISGAIQPSVTVQPLANTSYWAQITSANGIVEDTATTAISVTAPTPTALIASLASVTVDGSGNYVANIIVANTGNTVAAGAAVTAASLIASQSGRAVITPTSTLLPVIENGLVPGVSIPIALTFPASAGAPGTAAALRWSMTYSAGNASGTLRLTLP